MSERASDRPVDAADAAHATSAHDTNLSSATHAAGSAKRRAAIVGLLAVTLIWGCTFVWMRQALEASQRVLGPGHSAAGVGLFLAARFGCAAILVAACAPSARRIDRAAWRGGALLGGLLYVGFVFQMFGLEGVTPAVSAFLTSLYVLFTAVLHARVERRRIGGALVLGALLATAGAALIRDPRATVATQPAEGLPFRGELLTLACAFVFAVHILATDRVTKSVSALPVTVTSLVVVALGSIALVGVDAAWHGGADLRTWGALFTDRAFLVPLALSCVLATALAITLMNVHQRALDPVRAAILYALEPIWAAGAGLIYGTDEFTAWLLIGGGLLVGGNLIAELGGAARSHGERETPKPS